MSTRLDKSNRFYCWLATMSPLLLLRPWAVSDCDIDSSSDPSCELLAPLAVKPFGAPVSCNDPLSMPARLLRRSRPITGTCCKRRSLMDFCRAYIRARVGRGGRRESGKPSVTKERRQHSPSCPPEPP